IPAVRAVGIKRLDQVAHPEDDPVVAENLGRFAAAGGTGAERRRFLPNRILRLRAKARVAQRRLMCLGLRKAEEDAALLDEDLVGGGRVLGAIDRVDREQRTEPLLVLVALIPDLIPVRAVVGAIGRLELL